MGSTPIARSTQANAAFPYEGDCVFWIQQRLRHILEDPAEHPHLPAKAWGLSAPESGGHYHEDVCPVEPISSVPANLWGGSKASRPGGITAGGSKTSGPAPAGPTLTPNGEELLQDALDEGIATGVGVLNTDEL